MNVLVAKSTASTGQVKIASRNLHPNPNPVAFYSFYLYNLKHNRLLNYRQHSTESISILRKVVHTNKICHTFQCYFYQIRSLLLPTTNIYHSDS